MVLQCSQFDSGRLCVSILELGWFSSVPSLILVDCVSILELGWFSNVPSLILADCVSILKIG